MTYIYIAIGIVVFLIISVVVIGYARVGEDLTEWDEYDDFNGIN